ncbi:DUF6193 family natural product biosynthesis protein [Streptomyces sp. NRRL S-1022]|uniref:DUF6193 family natural product biosynthesis protein n=1 Tax=Streptomyces sp. NRRL S-1022 TaxID=1463880 RepID=UPI000A5BCCFB|nr:DUF6193 family natural product biosynthesis protein [Streptomyces sp. NRRL S-1022]
MYPGVAAFGGLAAALRAEVEGHLGVAAVESSDSAPLLHATVASVLPYREPLRISAWQYERRWSISGTEPSVGAPLIDGTTDDLAEVAKAAWAWHDGEPLRGIRQTAPFVHLTGRFEVPDHDPARLAESEWQCMRQEAAELEVDWQEAYQALIEAAYAEPLLRALFPFRSHWGLRFSTTTRPAVTIVGPCLTANDDGTYGVGRGFITPDLGLFDSLHDAVAVAVRELPSGLGPVTLGSFPQPAN